MKKIISFVIIITIILTLAACGTSAPAENQEQPSELLDDVSVTSSFSDNIYTFNGTEYAVLSYIPIEDNYVMEMVDKGYINFDIYDPVDITMDMLTKRTTSRRIIVERIVGIVTNKERDGDGMILNSDDDNYNYISYSGTNLDYTTGTIVVTYLMYNPKTNYEDDIIERYDYILDRSYED